MLASCRSPALRHCEVEGGGDEIPLERLSGSPAFPPPPTLPWGHHRDDGDGFFTQGNCKETSRVSGNVPHSLDLVSPWGPGRGGSKAAARGRASMIRSAASHSLDAPCVRDAWADLTTGPF